MRTHS